MEHRGEGCVEAQLRLRVFAVGAKCHAQELEGLLELASVGLHGKDLERGRVAARGQEVRKDVVDNAPPDGGQLQEGLLPKGPVALDGLTLAQPAEVRERLVHERAEVGRERGCEQLQLPLDLGN
eukprot:7457742-Alexandrium_andersonii.AAC.1